MKKFMKRYFCDIDFDNHYELVHTTPRRSDDGKYNYEGIHYEYTFASMYVLNILLSEFKQSKLKEVIRWFNTGDDLITYQYGESFVIDLCKWFCFFGIPLSGREIYCESVNDNQMFVLPDIELICNYSMDDGICRSMVLYVPISSDIGF